MLVTAQFIRTIYRNNNNTSITICSKINGFSLNYNTSLALFKQNNFKNIIYLRNYSIMNRYKKSIKKDNQEDPNQKINPIPQDFPNQDHKNQKLKIKEKMDWKHTLIPPAPAHIKELQLKQPIQPINPRSLTVAMVGAPNAGKSTLVNSFLNQKISGVSPKAQTTRHNIMGIYTKDNVQMLFQDTPGIVAKHAQKKIIKEIVNSAWRAVDNADLIVWIADVARRTDEHILYIQENITALVRQKKRSAILVLNKADLVTQKMVYNRIKELNPEKIFADIFVISAIKNEGIKELREYLINKAVPREWEYHSDIKCDQSEFMRVVEIIREKLYIRFNQEIPYLVKQSNSGWEITKKRRFKHSTNFICI